jgi:tetratricopeptide (TPR) repeat protein
VKKSLLKEQSIYSLHQLIREFFREQLEELAEKEEIKRFFVALIVEEAKKITEYMTIKIFEQVTPTIPHIIEMAENLADYLSDDDFILPFEGLLNFYQFQSLKQQQEDWAKYCLAKAKERFKNNDHHPCIVNSKSNLGNSYCNQGRYQEADLLIKESLEINRQLFGNEHKDVATSLHGLADVYYFQEKYQEAESLYSQALAIQKKF